MVKFSPFIHDQIVIKEAIDSLNSYELELRKKGFFTINDFLNLEKFRKNLWGSQLIAKLTRSTRIKQTLIDNLEINKQKVESYLLVFNQFSVEERNSRNPDLIFTRERLTYIQENSDLQLTTINDIITRFKFKSDFLLRKGKYANFRPNSKNPQT